MNKKLVKQNKKIIVKDFINHFRNRYIKLSRIIQNNNNLSNLISINKIQKEKEQITIIGIIRNKKITKKGHLMLSVEDLTGNLNIIIPLFKKELFNKSLDICLDSVIAFSGTGNNEIMFSDKIYFPESILNERKKTKNNESAIFIGDIHLGSKNFMKKEFEKLIKYLGVENQESKDIKYLFIVGDLVGGIDVCLEKELEIKDLKSQFDELAKLLDKIRKDIMIIISPGVHDGIRLMEPQPILNEKYTKNIKQLENVKFIGNPESIKIENLEILVYHGFSFNYYANNIKSLIESDSINNPEKIMKYLLKNRHLAPTNISNQYFPSSEDKLLINEVPDIFVCGYTHRSSIVYENNILLISVSSWEKTPEYKKNKENFPDFAKVPLVNLHTRAIKILDFNVKEKKI